MAVLRLIRAPNLIIAAAGVFAGGWIALAQIGCRRAAVRGAVGRRGGRGRQHVERHEGCRGGPRESSAAAAGRRAGIAGLVEFILFAGTVLALVFAALVSAGRSWPPWLPWPPCSPTRRSSSRGR